MRAMRVRAALLCFLVLAAAPCGAAPFGVRLGLDKLVLDAPPGFSDTTDLASPRLQDLAATLTPASNRVLLFALADSDVRKFTQGDQLDARRYMIVVTPRASERERFGPERFAAEAAESLRELGKPVKAADLFKYMEAQPIGKANLLAELRRDAGVVSVLQATRLPPLPGASMWDDKKPQYLIHTTALLLLQGKLVQVSVYSMYEAETDVDWVKQTTQRWIEDLQRLNR
jgi:hypothetical protein